MAAPLANFYVRSVSQIFCRLSVSQCRHLRLNQPDCSRIKTLSNAIQFQCKNNEFKLVRSHGTTTRQERKCWKCNTPTNNDTELFFCNCGVVQNVPSDLTYFEALKFPESFNIDVTILPELYKDLQRNLHPDKYSQKSKEEQEVAANQSAFINKAYTTLLKPLERGLYLLELRGDPLEEKNTSVDSNFLMEVMEINEDLLEASNNEDAMKELENINSNRVDLCVLEISQAFKEVDISRAKENLIKLKYFCNIEQKIKEIYRTHMDNH